MIFMTKFQPVIDETREAMYPEELSGKVVHSLAAMGYRTTIYVVETENGIEVLKPFVSDMLTEAEKRIYRLPASVNAVGGRRVLLASPYYDYEAGQLVLPMEYKNRKVVLHVQGARQDEMQDFEALGRSLSVSFYNAFAREEDRYRAEHDMPTGLFNKQYFMDRLAEAFDIARKEGKPISVIMLDIDYFRTLNEKYGHPKVDRYILKPFADLLKANVSNSKRKTRPLSDVLARYGGEEISFSGFTDTSGAVMIGERIRRSTALASFAVPSDTVTDYVHITLSGGIASFPDHVRDPLDLLDGADEALFEAKRNGRNIIYVYKDGRMESVAPSP